MKANGRLSRLIGLICVLSLALVFAMTGCVKIVPATGITVSQSELSVAVGSTAKLRATVEPANAYDTRVYWDSTDETVATVDSRGKVTGVAEGTAVISVETRDGRYFAECKVTVFAKNAIWDGETPSEQPDGFVTPDEEDPEADPNLIVIEDAQALAYFAAQINAGVSYAGKTVQLAHDLDLNNQSWTPMRMKAGLAPAVIDGQGHKILNLSAEGPDRHCGFIGDNSATIEIRDLTFENASLTNTGSFAGTVIAYQYGVVTLKNVDVVNSEIKGRETTDTVKDIRIGGLVGFSILNDGAKLTLENCTVKGCEFYGYHNVGGLVGSLYDCWGDGKDSYGNGSYVPKNAWTMTGCEVSGCTFTVDGPNQNYVNAFAVDSAYVKTFDEATAAFVALGNTETDNTFVYTRNILVVAADTYEIRNKAGLEEFRDKVNAGTSYAGKTVRLGCDIDLENEAWTPIGTQAHPFGGLFDGANHCISNLTIDSSTQNDVGLFGFFGNSPVGDFSGVKNLTLDTVTITAHDRVGAVVGNALNFFSIENCKVQGEIRICGHEFVGGIAGYYYPAIRNSSVIGDEGSYIRGFQNIGGVVGYLGEGYNQAASDLSGMSAAIDVYGANAVGGIVGRLQFNREVNEPSFTGKVTYEATEGETSDNGQAAIGGIVGDYLGSSANGISKIIGAKINHSVITGAVVETTNLVAGAPYDGTQKLNVTGTEGTGNTVLVPIADGFSAVNGAYEISNAAGFRYFGNSVNTGTSYAGKTVQLGCDIDLENEEWTPIGKSGSTFQGTFDGRNYTISNLKIDKPGTSDVGLFGFTTTPGVLKNFTVENADVKGYLDVGAIAGSPYTAGYENITLKGLVKIEGFCYVGGMFGKNVYASVSGLTINADEGSYVKAESGEYRSYVGGVIGFMGEGSHKVSDVVSDIDVYGSTCDVGGIVGIAHYGNTFENITCTGNVYGTNFIYAENLQEIGGIAGVWMNSAEGNVTFVNCSFTGTLSCYDATAETYAEKFVYDGLVGQKYYPDSNAGKLFLNGKTMVSDSESLSSVISSAETDETVEVGLGEGEFKLSDNLAKDKEVVISGTEDTVVSVVDTSKGGYEMSYQSGATLTFKGITVQGQASGKNFGGIANVVKTTYIDCTIKGKITLYGDAVFQNCTFENDADYSVWTWGASKVTFENCEFECKGKAVLLYGGADGKTGVTTELVVKDCTFTDSANGAAGKAAIEIGNDYDATYSLTVTNTTVTGFSDTANSDKETNIPTNTNVWSNKNGMDKDHLSVTVDGVKVY